MSGLPPDHPLAGCVEKYLRAYEHFDLLQEEIRTRYAPGEPDFIGIGKEVHPRNHRIFRHYVETVTLPPVRWATIIGDVVHNLRSVLDHLVFELSFLGRNGVPPTKHVAFPVSSTRANWESSYVQDTMLQGVSTRHRAMLYRFQPCYRRKDTATPRAIRRRSPNAFADLNDLWNDDKHRMLLPTYVAPTSFHMTIADVSHCRVVGHPRPNMKLLGRPFQEKAELVRIPIEPFGPNPNVEMHFEIECEIGLRDGVPIRDRLAGMSTWVKEIIEYFEPEFTTATALGLWGLERGGRIKPAPPVDRRRMWMKVHEVVGGGTPPLPHWAPRKGPDGGSVYDD